jgi:predicted DNA-binding transcriptional regulator YafY
VKPETFFKLAVKVQGVTAGLTLDEIAEFVAECEGVRTRSRKTAERARDGLQRLFSQLEETTDAQGDRKKRWRLPSGVVNSMVTIEGVALAELAHAAAYLRAEGMDDRAKVLEALSMKLAALLPQKGKLRAERDLEDTLESEGLAMRPGPRPRIAPEVLGVVRTALLRCERLRISYRRRRDNETIAVEVEPHGIILGLRHYLVAFTAGRPEKVPPLYALPNILSIEPTGAVFERQPGFDLQAFAERSFGVFQEDPMEVVWHFVPDRAADVMEHHFHPTEQKTRLDDGSVEVRFTAGGLHEMVWHLFTWGKDVKVIGPEQLRVRYQEMLREAEAALLGG